MATKTTPKKSTTTTKTTTAKRAPAKKPTTAKMTVAPKTVTAATPTHDEIARRAYQLFEDRGFQHGHDIEDWKRAEAELTQGL